MTLFVIYCKQFVMVLSEATHAAVVLLLLVLDDLISLRVFLQHY
jgi:hypothetical protein